LNVVSLLLPLLPRECEIQSQMLSGNEWMIIWRVYELRGYGMKWEVT